DPGPAGAGFSKPAAAPMPAPEIPKFSEHYKLAYLTADLPCSVDHGIIGLMDPAHGPFVHQAWWWRTQKSIHEKRKNFEPIPYGFRMSAHTPSSNSAPYKLLRLYADADSITTTIDFVLPNLRSEVIRAGKYWFSSLTTVTPITRNQCRIDVVAAWNLFRWIPFGPQLLKFVFAKFVEQDDFCLDRIGILELVHEEPAVLGLERSSHFRVFAQEARAHLEQVAVVEILCLPAVLAGESASSHQQLRRQAVDIVAPCIQPGTHHGFLEIADEFEHLVFLVSLLCL